MLLQNSFASQHFDDMFRGRGLLGLAQPAPTGQPEYADYRLGSCGPSARPRAGAWSGCSSRPAIWAISTRSCGRSPGRSSSSATVTRSKRSPSYASLVQAVREPNSDAVSADSVGEHALRRAAVACDRALDVRAAVGRERFVDVPYSRLLEDPLDCVRAIYDRYGRALEHGESAAMTRWLAENPRYGGGVHRYSLERFGLTPARVTAAFARYLDELRPALA